MKEDELNYSAAKIKIAFFDVDEYRKKTSRTRRGSERVERIPTRFCGTVSLAEKEDYARVFLPATLADPFTVKAYAKETGIAPRYAALGISILSSLGILSRDGKEGRAYLYRKL